MTQHPPQAWSGLVEFKRAQEITSSLKLVNDTAKRAVKQVTDYMKTLKTDDLQVQLLLQHTCQPLQIEIRTSDHLNPYKSLETTQKSL